MIKTLGDSIEKDDLGDSLVFTASVINLYKKDYEKNIVYFLEKFIKILPHKSFLYASLATKINSHLAKKVVERIILWAMPSAFSSGDKMACSACIRFLG
jgi:hypothetical protein